MPTKVGVGDFADPHGTAVKGAAAPVRGQIEGPSRGPAMPGLRRPTNRSFGPLALPRAPPQQWQEDKARPMPFSTATGLSLYYDIVGDGPALCLINGYRLSGAAWPASFIARLSARCCVIFLDNRGTGRSEKPDSGYEFGKMAKDVVGLLNDLRLPRVNLFGFSMGGAIAQEVALRYADRVGRLILFGTFCGGIWAEPASLSVFRRLSVTGNQSPEDAARQAWPVTYSPDYLAANAEAVEQQLRREMEHPTPMFVAQRQMEALRQFDRYWDLPRIAARTLVATGTHDILVKPRNSMILASRIPNARLELLADLGHRAVWEAPEEIADLISDFLCGPAGRSQIVRAPGPKEAMP
jgi:3-oxoadipate enol-lactonase